MTETLTGQFATVGRSGVIVAMSTGLVASVSAPAQALGGTAAAASVSSANAFVSGRSTVLLGARTSALDAAISAPNAATVRFEARAFKAVPARMRKAVKKAVTISARTSSRATASAANPPVSTGSVRGTSILAIAARYVGSPYVYGGTTPRGFDCSGFTGYVYRQLGFSLPRTANAQMLATKRISRSEARAGDLVFFVSGGRAYHSGVYAGSGMMYDSPRRGKTLQKREIWSADVVFTRVTG